MSSVGNPIASEGRRELRISVIVPAFNREAIIANTIESVLAQRRLPDQIVFCDDGSSDGTVEVIHQSLSGSDIPYQVIEVANAGPSNARKVAVEHAVGDWFFFLDSDDQWHADYLSASEQLILTSESSPEVIVTNFRKVYLNEGQVHEERSKFDQAPVGFWALGFKAEGGAWIAGKAQLFEQTLSFQPCFPSALACSREAYDRVGGITLKSSSLKSEDSHFTRKLYFYCTVAFQRAVYVDIVIHGENRSMSGNQVLQADKLSGKIEILKLMLQDSQIRAQSQHAVMSEIGRESTSLFNSFYWAGDFRRALACYGEIPPHRRTLRLWVKKMICQIRTLV